MALPHEAILGINISSALVDAFLYHSWPLATRDEEMHPLVLRKSWSLELPHVEKLHSSLLQFVKIDQHICDKHIIHISYFIFDKLPLNTQT